MRWPLFLLLPLLSGCCGYRLGRGELENGYQSISVCCVANDTHGLFTLALLRELKSKSDLTVVSSGGDLFLNISLICPEDENCGYRYARKKNGDLTHIVVPIEAHLYETAVVELIDQKEGSTLFGPCEISTTLSYDYQSDFTHLNFHNFSLGQLEMHDLAKDEALSRLHALLAEKVVDVLGFSW